MRSIDKTITVWQAGVILFILLFANKVLVLPSLLYKGAKLGGIAVPIVLFVFELFLLYLFYKLKTKYPNETFSEIIKNHFGKVTMWVCYTLFMIYFLGKAILLYNVTYVFFKNFVYKDSNNLLFLFCFMPIINHMAILGLRVIGRTSQLFFPIVVVVAFFCLLTGFFGITGKPLLFDSSFDEFLITALKHISAFGDTLFLFVVMDKVTVKKGQWKILFSFAGVAMVLVCLVTIVFSFSYTNTSFMHPFAMFEIMSYVKECGGLGRVDIIAMVLIIILTYLQLTYYIKGFVVSFHGIFKNVDKVYSVLTFDFVFVILITFLVVNLEKTVFYGETYLPIVAIVPFVIVPIITFIVTARKKKREGNK